jgi:hypothetical protein
MRLAMDLVFSARTGRLLSKVDKSAQRCLRLRLWMANWAEL